MSAFGSQRICPFRIMFIASYPAMVLWRRQRIETIDCSECASSRSDDLLQNVILCPSPDLNPPPLGGPLSAVLYEDEGMAEYRHSGHAVCDIKYHLVWTAKYRHKILRGEAAERARDLTRQICPLCRCSSAKAKVRLAIHGVRVHSLRSAVVGSTDAARMAGARQAKITVMARIIGTTAKVMPSNVDTWKSMLFSTCVSANEAANPIARPSTAGFNPSTRTIRLTSIRLAPSAIRIPISGVL